MKKSSYGERDYAFGLRMLRLRIGIGLTQAGLAGLLGISRQALGEWESGSSYPKAEHLKYVIALGVHQQAFAAGHEEEEIRALWRAAHQKGLLDEPWLQGLLSFTLQPVVLEYVTTRLAGERQDSAGTACAPDPAWTFPGSRQGVCTTDLGAAAGSRAGIFSACLPEVYSGGKAITPAARPTA